MDGLLTLCEGWALYRRFAWAPWLVVITTGSLLPFEAFELARRVPGDVLHVESEVVGLAPSRSRPDRGTVTIRSETRTQRGEVVQMTLVKLLVPRRVKIDDASQPAEGS